MICKDVIEELPDPENFDPEDPPPSIVVISMGTDTTDLIVTNGIKLWLRNIPIGGSHFTKQLAREMKLTQTKAEHLKRNAKMAENPKEVFQAMRPVFNDLVNEVQRSLTFFGSMDKAAEISKIVLMGNAAKLPGLRQYLNKQLEIDVEKIEQYNRLAGDAITSQKSFDENLLSFAPCYGLCLQGLNQSQLKTSLLPKELSVERVIRAKKPWILASVGALMLGCVLGLYFEQNALWTVDPEYKGTNTASWKEAVSRAKLVATKSSSAVAIDNEQKANLLKLNLLGAELSAASDRKTLWMEMYSAIYQALPRDPFVEELKAQGISSVNPSEFPFKGRKEIYVDHLESEYFKDLAVWFEEVKDVYNRQTAEIVAQSSSEDGADEEAAQDDWASDGTEDAAGPSNAMSGKPGWVIELQGHHFHNFRGQEDTFSERDYVRATLIDALQNKVVKLPGGEFTFADLGVSFPTLVRADASSREVMIEFDPAKAREKLMGAGRGGAMGMGGMRGRGGAKEIANGETTFDAIRFTFVVQMAWQPRSPEERLRAKEERLKLEQEAKDAAEAAVAGDEVLNEEQ